MRLGLFLLSTLLAAPCLAQTTCPPVTVLTWDPRTPGQFDSTRDIDAGGPTNRVYVVPNGTIVRAYDADGNLEATYNGTNIEDVTVDDSGFVYTKGPFPSSIIRIYNPAGILVHEWGQYGTAWEDIHFPARQIAAASADTVFLVEDARVTAYTRWGQRTLVLGESAPGSLITPFDAAIAPDGTIYVSDLDLDEIKVYDAAGTYLRKWSVSSGFLYLDVDTDGTLVALSPSEVTRYDAFGAVLEQSGFGSPDGRQGLGLLDGHLFTLRDNLVEKLTPPSPGCGPDVTLHVAPVLPGNPCNKSTAAEDVVTWGAASGTGAFYHVYVLASPADSAASGILALEYGLDTQESTPGALQFYGSTHCASTQFTFGDWPKNGGVALSWSPGCASDAAVMPMHSFYVGAYAPASLAVVAHPNTGKVDLASCDAVYETVSPSNLGWVSFGSPGGCNAFTDPCGSAQVLSVPAETDPQLRIALLANPVRARATFRLLANQPETVRLDVVDVRGRTVWTHWMEVTGSSEVSWDLRDDRGLRVAPGHYFYILRANQENASGRLTVLP